MFKILVISTLAAFSAFHQPTYAASQKELVAACAKNPQHAVCVALEEKKQKAKARKAEKLQQKIDAVNQNR